MVIEQLQSVNRIITSSDRNNLFCLQHEQQKQTI